MTTTKPRAGKAEMQRSPRISITFPSDLYQTIEVIAKQKKVSLAWVVRDAAEKYITEQKPTIRKQRQG